jgi:hypothetical protein
MVISSVGDELIVENEIFVSYGNSSLVVVETFWRLNVVWENEGNL